MPEPIERVPPLASKRSGDRGVAVAIALSILICLATFVWIFVELEPFMNDFTGSDTLVTPGPIDPDASPVEGIETSTPGGGP